MNSGKKAVRKVFEAFFGNVKDLETEILDLDAAASDDMGVAWSLQRFRWKFPDGSPGAATVRVTHCFRREGGAWRMFHSHVSAPVHAGTGKAEMNLDP